MFCIHACFVFNFPSSVVYIYYKLDRDFLYNKIGGGSCQLANRQLQRTHRGHVPLDVYKWIVQYFIKMVLNFLFIANR